MGKRLASYVHVTDDSGVPHGFAPGDELPDWAAKQITNPAAYDESDDDGDKPRRGRKPKPAGQAPEQGDPPDTE